MKRDDLDGWRNYPTKWWAQRLSAPRWRDKVVEAAQQARTIEGFRQANLEALLPQPDELHAWTEQWVDWAALWHHFKRWEKPRDDRPQAFGKKEVA